MLLLLLLQSASTPPVLHCLNLVQHLQPRCLCNASDPKMHHARERARMNSHMCRPTSSCFQPSSNNPKISASKKFPPGTGRFTCLVDGVPPESTSEHFHPPQLRALQLSSQNPQIPVTSDHTVPSSLALLPAQASASFLCSRKV